MYDLIIIGGGPAGLTAAIYAIRKRLNCLLISPDLGGKAVHRMLIEGMDTYQVINGADLVQRFRNEIEYLDFARELTKVTKLELIAPAQPALASPRGLGLPGNGRHFVATTVSGQRLEARSVILATGADPVWLAVPGASDFRMRGVTYSTVSYAPLYVHKQVALVGAGAMALRGAAELAQIVTRLYLVAPTRGELDTPLGRRLQAAENVTVFENWEPVAVEGDTFARQLIVGAPDGGQRKLDVDAIFVELGLRPNSELVRDWVKLDEQGRVIVGCGTETSVPGLFAAGDVTNLPAEQVLIAIGEGAQAALAAYEYLIRLEG